MCSRVSGFVTSPEQCNVDTDKSVSNVIVLLGRKFNKVMKRIDRKSRLNVKNMQFDISKNSGFQRMERTYEKKNQGKGIRCHGCEGFGDIKSECPTYLKNQKKGFSVSWSDDDSEEPDDETAKHVTTLTGRGESDEDCNDVDVSYDELVDS